MNAETHRPGVDAFDAVAHGEAAWLRRRRVAAGVDPARESVGLAFSGGGIRSATFNLGVLEALDAAGLMDDVDYLSSVSGGGYIAGCYAWMRAHLPRGVRRPFEAPLRDGMRVVDWLRRHGRFLVAARGYSLWTLAASILAATFLNLLVLGPAVVLVVDALTLGWLPLQWPDGVERVLGVQGHHGYLLLLAAGAACLAAFPFAALMFGVFAGIGAVQGTDQLRIGMGRLLATGALLIGLGSIPLVHALGERWGLRFESDLMQAMGRHLAYLTPMLSGLLALLGGRGGRGVGARLLAQAGLALLVFGLLVFAYHLAVHVGIVREPWFLGVLLLSLVLAFACDVNRVSMHAYYRARLAETFLPPLPDATSAPAEFGLGQLRPDAGAPLPLINTTLNMSSSPDVRDHGREGASFFFSPLHYGSTATGFGVLADAPIALSTAMTISGAAVDPDTTATRSRPVSVLMALLNVRLGFWGDNPARTRAPRLRPWWWILIGREMTGLGLDARHARIHLSDGGHFENLGLYELVRRRVRTIVACDAGEDPDLALADLGRAIERARVDFGAEIDLDAGGLVAQHDAGHVARPYVLGTIRYADGSQGRIAYVKPCPLAGASADLYAYARAHPDFPNQSTANQFFGESEFEAYRVLGRETIGRMLGTAPAPAGVADWFARLRDGAATTAS